MTPIRLGQIWIQTKGKYKGRNGLVEFINRWTGAITLAPATGTCRRPAKQRRTTINITTFRDQWQLAGDAAA